MLPTLHCKYAFNQAASRREELLASRMIFFRGCENSDSQSAFTKGRQWRLFCYLIADLLLGRYYELRPETLGFASGVLHEKILQDAHCGQMVLHAKSGASLKAILSSATLSSHLSYRDRLKIAIDALATYQTLEKGFGISRWIEYTLIRHLMNCYSAQGGVREVVVASMTDRYVSWITELAQAGDTYVTVYQHGTLLHFKGLPHKLTIARFYTYNEHETAAIRRSVVANDDCQFVETGFKSYVAFVRGPRYKDGLNIGIVSQGDVMYNLSLIRAISRHLCTSGLQARITLMTHPTEKRGVNYYQAKRRFPLLHVEHKSKYLDFDYVFLRNSTMVYDYTSSGYKGAIVVIDDVSHFSFLSRDAYYFASIDDFDAGFSFTPSSDFLVR